MTPVEALRKARGWSQQELARHAGVSKNSVGAIERGEDLKTIAPHQKIAHALGVELREIVASGPLKPAVEQLTQSRDLAQGAATLLIEPAAQRSKFLQQDRRESRHSTPEQSADSSDESTAPDPGDASLEPAIVDASEEDKPSVPLNAPLHPSIPTYSGYAPSPPDIETRQRVIGVLSAQTLTVYELEALIFVGAVTHCSIAAALYELHPEDYRGRLAALHRAIDDADQYVRAQRLLPESGTVPERPINLDDSVRMGPPEIERFEQAIQRWRMVHRPILAGWSEDVYPWWDDQVLPWGGGRTSDGGAEFLLSNLRYFEDDLRTGQAWVRDEDDGL